MLGRVRNSERCKKQGKVARKIPTQNSPYFLFAYNDVTVFEQWRMPITCILFFLPRYQLNVTVLQSITKYSCARYNLHYVSEHAFYVA